MPSPGAGGGGRRTSHREGNALSVLRPRPAALVVLVVGLCLTLVLAWAASDAADRNDEALLGLQVRQTAAAIAAALPAAQAQLSDALTVASATGSAATFSKFVTRRGLPRGVVSESLWEKGVSGTVMLAAVGASPVLARDGRAPAFFAGVRSTTRLTVTPILAAQPRRVGYALASKGSPSYVAYVESALPSNRKLHTPASSPFGDLNLAVYIGSSAHRSNLVEASVPTPIRGEQASASTPFGNTTITVVATPKTSLVGWLSRALPWIVLGAGAVLTFASAATVEFVARRRAQAEAMSAELGTLYAQQRSIATELQHALLPTELPLIDGVEIATRYLPGSEGVDVGGDWYDVIPVGPDRFMLVVGDVSGRGIPAASVMASLRFASRAFVVEGQGPGSVLANLARTLDFSQDGHFATALCMLVDVESGVVEIANAGHLPPVVRTNGTVEVVDTVVAAPIGVARPSDDWKTSRLQLTPGATVVAYTDGLIERRGEGLDDGIRRLTLAVAEAPRSVDLLVAELASTMTSAGTEDDIVVIGFQWKD